MNYFHLELEIGKLTFIWNDGGLLSKVSISDLAQGPKSPTFSFRAKNIPPHSLQLVEKVCNYFETGEPISVLNWDLVDRENWTDFQFKVYEAALGIPHGETRSYAWIGEKIRKPLASRAVGQALKRNPIPILIPCHRVVSSQGGLGGFMGKSDPTHPELILKKRLLSLEHAFRNPFLPFINASGVCKQVLENAVG